MAFLKGKGVPTRKTAAALGDIYMDVNTGAEYKCTFAYRGSFDMIFDCQWIKISDGDLDVDDIFEEEEVKEEPVSEPVEEVVEEAAEEEPKEEQPKKPNYHKQYSKHNK